MSLCCFFFLHCTCARKSSNSALHTSCPWLHATLVYLYHHHLSSGPGYLLVSPCQTLVTACCFILLLVSHLCFASTAAPGQPLAPLLRAFKHKGFPWGQPTRGKESQAGDLLGISHQTPLVEMPKGSNWRALLYLIVLWRYEVTTNKMLSNALSIS